MPENIPAFSLGPIPVFGDLILAPMSGFCDPPFRALCRLFGSSISYTPFANAIGLLQGAASAWDGLRFFPEERPIVFQILDNDEDRLLRAVRQIIKLHPDAIDVNMGCSVRRVSSRGAGAGLLQDPSKIARIIDNLRNALTIPITAKIRLGWDNDSRNYLEVAQAIEESGAQLIAVHARTRNQGYSGKADWDAIADIKQHVSIPVLGNGDVHTIDDIERLKRHTRCDGVMIGRASIGNPWIFQRRSRDEVSQPEIAAVIHFHLDRMLDYYGPKRGLILFRKHLARYISPFKPRKPLRYQLLTCIDVQQLRFYLVQLGLARPTMSSLPTINDSPLH